MPEHRIPGECLGPTAGDVWCYFNSYQLPRTYGNAHNWLPGSGHEAQVVVHAIVTVNAGIDYAHLMLTCGGAPDGTFYYWPIINAIQIGTLH